MIPSLVAEPEVPTGGKGAKAPAKGAAPEEPLRWTRLSVRLPKPRFHHSAVFRNTGDNNFSVAIMGGLNHNGLLPLFPIELHIANNDNSVPKEKGSFVATEEHADNDSRYGGAAVSITEADGITSGIIYFGGSGKISSSTVYVSFFDQAPKSGEWISKINRMIEEINRLNKQIDDEGGSATKNSLVHLTFPNGDVYDGEILKDDNVEISDATWENSIIEGQGRMIYQDGSIYDVSF